MPLPFTEDELAQAQSFYDGGGVSQDPYEGGTSLLAQPVNGFTPEENAQAQRFYSTGGLPPVGRDAGDQLAAGEAMDGPLAVDHGRGAAMARGASTIGEASAAVPSTERTPSPAAIAARVAGTETHPRSEDGGRAAEGWSSAPGAQAAGVPAASPVAGSAKPAGGYGVGGGAGGPNLGKAVKGAESAYDATMEREKVLKADTVAQENAKTEFLQARRQEEAEREKRMLQIDHDEERDRFQVAEDMRMRNDAAIEQLASARIDPQRLFADAGVATRFQFTLGAALGGLLQGRGVTKDNPFLTQMNKLVDDDIRAQETELKNKQTTVQARERAYGQLLETNRDKSIADKVYREGIFANAKEQIAAEAMAYDSPIATAHAQEAINDLDKEIKKLQVDRAKAEKAEAERKAAAAAAAKRQAAQDEWNRAKDVRTADQHDRELSIREAEARNKAAADPNSPAAKQIAGERAQSALDDAWDLTLKDVRGPVGNFLVNPKGIVGKHVDNALDYGRRDRVAAGVGRLITAYKLANGGGTGLNSDKDMEAAITPLMPQDGDNTETLTRKKKLIDTALNANYGSGRKSEEAVKRELAASGAKPL